MKEQLFKFVVKTAVKPFLPKTHKGDIQEIKISQLPQKEKAFFSVRAKEEQILKNEPLAENEVNQLKKLHKPFLDENPQINPLKVDLVLLVLCYGNFNKGESFFSVYFRDENDKKQQQKFNL